MTSEQRGRLPRRLREGWMVAIGDGERDGLVCMCVNTSWRIMMCFLDLTLLHTHPDCEHHGCRSISRHKPFPGCCDQAKHSDYQRPDLLDGRVTTIMEGIHATLRPPFPHTWP